MKETAIPTFDGSKFTSEAFTAELQAQNPSTDIKCRNLTAQQKQALFSYLKNVTSLKSLAIETSEINLVEASTIANIIKTNMGLEELNLAGNKIGPEGIALIVSSITSHPAIEVLNLNDNAICSSKARSFQDVVGQDSHEPPQEEALFQRLDGEFPSHEPRGSTLLSRLGNTAIMFFNKLVEPDITPIADLLQTNQILREITLRENNLNNNDAEKILEALRNNPNNRITFMDIVPGNFLLLQQYGNVIVQDADALSKKTLDEIAKIIDRNMKKNPDPKANHAGHYHPHL